MQLTSNSFANKQRISGELAFGVPDPVARVRLSNNRNPHLKWTDVPAGTRSFALICVDRDVPTRPDDVNKEDRMVPASLLRTDFYHWAMVDIAPEINEIAAAACSEGVTARGKQFPKGPKGSRQGRNDYTDWFAADPNMQGTYLGYDGPCPPWNDTLLHHYHFILYAIDLEHCPVEEDFSGPDVLAAIRGHVLAEALLIGTYALNPSVI